MAITFFRNLTRQTDIEDSRRKIIARIGNHEFLNELRRVSNNHQPTGHKSILIPNAARGLVK